MRLELDIHNIKDVEFGKKTAISNGVLYINRHELQGLLQNDKRLGRKQRIKKDSFSSFPH